MSLCLLTAAALGCSDPPADVGDSSSSSGDATAGPTTSAATTAPSSTGESSTSASTSVDDSSEGSGSSGIDSADASSSEVSSSDSSSGGPTNDCTDEKDPCILELDAPANGEGGVDQFYVYVVGSGSEHVTFEASGFAYVAWADAPWSLGCNLDGPCCQSDGPTACEKPLAQAGIDLPVGATAYVFVYAMSAYEVAITSG